MKCEDEQAESWCRYLGLPPGLKPLLIDVSAMALRPIMAASMPPGLLAPVIPSL